jgi:hypothetical protein
MPGPDPRTKRFMIKGLKNIIDRESRKKAAKEADMEAEKVKVQDEKDMFNVQGGLSKPDRICFTLNHNKRFRYLNFK